MRAQFLLCRFLKIQPHMYRLNQKGPAFGKLLHPEYVSNNVLQYGTEKEACSNIFTIFLH